MGRGIEAILHARPDAVDERNFRVARQGGGHN